MSFTHVSQFENTPSEILKGLDYYKDDIRLMEGQLLEAAGRTNDFEARQGIEHFESQFLIQRNNIGNLRHRVSDYPGYTEEKKELFVDEFRAIEKSLSELSQEFKRFLAKYA